MIERLLAADRALEAGQVELAERLYGQVAAADPRNAIAMVGQAKVAQRLGDLDAARRHVARALATDPDDEAARRLATELETATGGSVESEPTGAGPALPTVLPEPGSGPVGAPALPQSPAATQPARRSILGSVRRLLRRLIGR